MLKCAGFWRTIQRPSQNGYGEKKVEFLESADMAERMDKFTITVSRDGGNMMMSTGESIYSDSIKGTLDLINQL